MAGCPAPGRPFVPEMGSAERCARRSRYSSRLLLMEASDGNWWTMRWDTKEWNRRYSHSQQRTIHQATQPAGTRTGKMDEGAEKRAQNSKNQFSRRRKEDH